MILNARRPRFSHKFDFFKVKLEKAYSFIFANAISKALYTP